MKAALETTLVADQITTTVPWTSNLDRGTILAALVGYMSHAAWTNEKFGDAITAKGLKDMLDKAVAYAVKDAADLAALREHSNNCD